jgi:plastocyanin
MGENCRSIKGLIATRVAPDPVSRVTCVTLALAAVLLVAGVHVASATTLDLRVVDKNGNGVSDVVVVANVATSAHAASNAKASGKNAVMDQQSRKFVPQVLVVQTGTVVAFPNNDTVSHQVYSFSPARSFQLPLYKGEAHTPITFDKPGLVVLGCNIHDEMVGYVYVTESRYFAKTDADGRAQMRDVPLGTYRFDVWGPRVADTHDSLARDFTVTDAAAAPIEWRLQKPVRAHVSPGPRDVDWDY